VRYNIPPAQFPEYQYAVDREGRFRIEGLAPGVRYTLCLGSGLTLREVTVRSGETKDLGDIKIEPSPLPPRVVH
jgi:hypothetical protein